MYGKLKNLPMNSRYADVATEIPKLKEMDRARGELVRLASAPTPEPFGENGWGRWLSERTKIMCKLQIGRARIAH